MAQDLGFISLDPKPQTTFSRFSLMVPGTSTVPKPGVRFGMREAVCMQVVWSVMWYYDSTESHDASR